MVCVYIKMLSMAQRTLKNIHYADVLSVNRGAGVNSHAIPLQLFKRDHFNHADSSACSNHQLLCSSDTLLYLCGHIRPATSTASPFRVVSLFRWMHACASKRARAGDEQLASAIMRRSSSLRFPSPFLLYFWMIATIPPFVLIHMRNRKRHLCRAMAEIGESGLGGAFSIVQTSSRTNGGRPSFISGHGRQARYVSKAEQSERRHGRCAHLSSKASRRAVESSNMLALGKI